MLDYITSLMHTQIDNPVQVSNVTKNYLTVQIRISNRTSVLCGDTVGIS